MLCIEDISIDLRSQQYRCQLYLRDPEEKRSAFVFQSEQKTTEERCPYCQGEVYIDGYGSKTLKDIPIWNEIHQEISFITHRYECRQCGKKHTEEIPLQHPGTRVTERAARWIQAMLRSRIPIRSIQQLTGIHWEVIRNLQMEIMEETLEGHLRELKEYGYRPTILAVDEFAIHKGHTYATCVMDLETGEILWVGKGRKKSDFARFFEEIDPSFLVSVMAVAMDMNASYHLLVKEKLPYAQIVYDRYHMQAQYGKEVLGVVRLEEARAHKARSSALQKTVKDLQGEELKRVEEEVRQEKKQYTQIKRLRWSLLTNADHLSEERAVHLSEILESHSQLAVCYAMKEEMCRLFELRDPMLAEAGWRKWFIAAKESGIPALARFANLKEIRIDGLIAHAIYPISTGKLEGFNNKIKVSKRIAYGYRDDSFFFTLIKYLSLPSP